MERYVSDANKYPNVQLNQPGLEVGAPQLPLAHDQGWPDASKPVWGIDQMLLGENGQRKRTAKTILGLSAGAFWGIVVLLCVLIAGGVGGGVGAGLANRKSICSRYLDIASESPE
jgi:hypothetical protein